ncbi:MAG: sodium:solute symporter family protein [Firmicutes bacterium]|jgi:SSS family transporter|nr:sodium:solute symporter family protein [Bacillota bacterium]
MIYLLYFVVYSLLIIIFGKHGLDQVQDCKGFFIADASLELFTAVCTFAATWISAASLIALAGSIFVYGISSMTYSLFGWFVGAFLMLLLVSELRSRGALSIPEYVRYRYGSRNLQAVCGFVTIFTHILYIVIQIRGFGIVVSEILQIPYSMAIFLVYLFVLYTTFGGLYSVARTDILNFFLIAAGIVVTVFLVIQEAGGVIAVFQQARFIEGAAFPSADYYNTPGSLLHPLRQGNYHYFFLFSVFVGWALGKAANPQYLVRIIAARDRQTARQMVLCSLAIFCVLYAGLMVISIGGRVLQPQVLVDDIDSILPYIIRNAFSSHLAGFMLIGILAAVVSTANSQLLLVASSFSYDIYKNIINGGVSEERLLTINRVVIFVAGTVALMFSFTPPGALLVYGSYIWGVIAAVFFIPIYGGVLWPRGNLWGAAAAIYGGLVTSAGLFIADFYIFRDLNILHPAIPGVGTALLFYVLGTLFKERFDKGAANVTQGSRFN